jgi:hypothetical protein
MSEPRPETSILSHLRWRAILLGFVTDHGASQIMGIVIGIGAGIFLAAQGRSADLQRMTHESTNFLLVVGALGSFFTVVGGFVAGRLAPQARYWNAAAVGLVDILVGFLSHGHPPFWFSATGIAVTLPCALLGAFLAGLGQPPPPPPIEPAQPGSL